ncbi:MAG: hypothetical protein AAGA56_15730 [Myxococcota bacterium]
MSSLGGAGSRRKFALAVSALTSLGLGVLSLGGAGAGCTTLSDDCRLLGTCTSGATVGGSGGNGGGPNTGPCESCGPCAACNEEMVCEVTPLVACEDGGTCDAAGTCATGAVDVVYVLEEPGQQYFESIDIQGDVVRVAGYRLDDSITVAGTTLPATPADREEPLVVRVVDEGADPFIIDFVPSPVLDGSERLTVIHPIRDGRWFAAGSFNRGFRPWFADTDKSQSGAPAAGFFDLLLLGLSDTTPDEGPGELTVPWFARYARGAATTIRERDEVLSLSHSENSVAMGALANTADIALPAVSATALFETASDTQNPILSVLELAPGLDQLYPVRARLAASVESDAPSSGSAVDFAPNGSIWCVVMNRGNIPPAGDAVPLRRMQLA